MKKFFTLAALLLLPLLALAQPIIPSTGYTLGFMTNQTAASARTYLGISDGSVTNVSTNGNAVVTNALATNQTVYQTPFFTNGFYLGAINAQPAGSDILLNFNTSPADRAGASDAIFVIENFSTNSSSSGGQIGLATMGSDDSTNAVELQRNQIDWYQTPPNRIPGLLPGTTGIILGPDNANANGYYISEVNAAGFDNGNYPFMVADTANTLFRVPLYVAGIYQPKDVSYVFATTGVSVVPSQGSLYTNNGNTYYFVYDAGSGNFTLTLNVNPHSRGTITKISGTGDATISFSRWYNTTNGQYTFRATNSAISVLPTAGAVYSNGGFNYVVTGTTLTGSARDVAATINTDPQASGTLTRISGTGDATITYTSFSKVFWKDSFVINPKTGVVNITNTLNVISNLFVGFNGGVAVFRVNNLQWNAANDLAHFDGEAISRVSSVRGTNFNASQSGTGTIAFSTPNSMGLGQDGNKLTLFNQGNVIVDADTGPNTWRDRFDTDHFPLTSGWGSFGDATHFFGYAYFKTNIAQTLIVGAATNTATGTLVNTNWVSGQLYTNQTGRPILVCGNAVLTTAAVAGFSQMALRCSVTTTNYATVISAVAGLTGAMTNAMTPMIIPDSGVFTWTNTSSGAGDSSTTWGGQYLVQ